MGDQIEEGRMSYAGLEKRVGSLEDDVSKMRTDVAVLGRDVTDVKSGNTAILQAIQNLERRDASRPQPTNWKAVLLTAATIAAGIGSAATAVWWFIGTSPIVQDIDRRLTKLDDPDIGKVTRMESDMRWLPSVRQAGR